RGVPWQRALRPFALRIAARRDFAPGAATSPEIPQGEIQAFAKGPSHSLTNRNCKALTTTQTGQKRRDMLGTRMSERLLYQAALFKNSINHPCFGFTRRRSERNSLWP